MLTGLENPLHLVLLFGVILLVFGAKRLPEMGRGLGTGMRDFKSALTAPEPTHEDAPTPRESDPV